VKIAIVRQNYPPATFEGGISHYSELLGKSLLGLGHEVYAFTSTEFTRPTMESNGSSGVEIIRIEGPWNHNSINVIKKTAKNRKIDALILQYAPTSYSTPFRLKWALTRLPCQKITSFHTLWGGGFDRLMGLLMLFGCHKIIATNSEIMTLLEKYLPFLLKKTYWIPIGSNILPSDQPSDEKSSFKDSLFSYFGMLYPGKGLDLILDTLEELKRRGYRFSFKFIGGGYLDYESYEENFRKSIEKRDLNGFVEHLGRISSEEVSHWLNQSRFIYLPYDSGVSDRRGSLMAALAHGKAILTSPPAVSSQLFKNGMNMVWPDEPSHLGYVALIEKLLQDDKMIARLKQGAKELSSHFGWEKIAVEHELVVAHRQ
jgi:glycosyltransferase involved in cell wall biosynthesis